MLFTTTSQYAVLLLMLIVGWLFGFASHPGGRKWKQAYRDEQEARAEERAALEVRHAEQLAERDRVRAERVSPAASSARPAFDPPRA